MLRPTKFVVQSISLLYVVFYLVNANGTSATGSDMKIYKGLSAIGHKYLKHMVILMTHWSMCGGSILRPMVILTAAHCVSKNASASKSDLEAFISKSYVCAGNPEVVCNSRTLQKARVQNVYIHENYKTARMGDDVAIVILKTALVEDGKTVQRISLAKKAPSIGTTCTTIGWGRLDFHKNIAKIAQYTLLTRIPEEYCESMGDFHPKLCVGDKNETSGNCPGDSGGSLICDGRVAGVASRAKRSGNQRFTLFTDVFRYRNWINEIIGKYYSKMRSLSVRARAVDLCVIFVLSLFASFLHLFLF